MSIHVVKKSSYVASKILTDRVIFVFGVCTEKLIRCNYTQSHTNIFENQTKMNAVSWMVTFKSITLTKRF